MSETATLIGGTEPLILTIDNGGTSTRAALGTEDISRIETYNTPGDYNQAIDSLAVTAGQLLGGQTPDAVGVGVAGAVKDGRIVSAGELEKNGWCNRPFAEDIAAALGISVERVVLLNDCKAGANAERTARRPRPGQAG
ncbi:MAG TPA: ROK family protein, partial [Candidatus Saccharimonadales bacterium]|nr:ROK family protein [Candidatus Saccharimonadales bacterium]